MNLIYARVVEIYPEEGEPMGKVSVWGVLRAARLNLVPEARPGDTVLVCDGVAIGMVDGESNEPYEAGKEQGMGQAPKAVMLGSVPPDSLAGGDACATLKGATDVSGSSR
jgi:hydrogenase maturation factor